ncbi:MAG: gamma-glutamylcyclotransferase family protein [Erysipelotrichaceae bacterium]
MKQIQTEENLHEMEPMMAEVMECTTLSEAFLSRVMGLETEGRFSVLSEALLKQAPRDVRVGACYELTYHMAVLLVAYVQAGHAEYKELCEKSLAFGFEMGFGGHGYDSEATRLSYLTRLAELKFTQGELGITYHKQYQEMVDHYRNLYFYGNTSFGFSNFRDDVERLLRAVDVDTLFVYGTLQQGERNHHFLANATYQGDAMLHHYGLLELGHFPGMIECIGGIVHGELYQVDPVTKQNVDQLEAGLYECNVEIVEQDCKVYFAKTYVYVSSREDSDGERFPLSQLRGKWRAIDERYVWYVTYGSNINSQRFQAYLDKTKSNESYKLSEPWIIKHPMYFARQSSRWNQQGVAFLDTEQHGRTYGVRYLITKEQFKEIQVLEGKTWYNKIAKLDAWGDVPMWTLTSSTRHEDELPSDVYVEVIAAGLKEHYGLSDQVIAQYLKQDTKKAFSFEQILWQ